MIKKIQNAGLYKVGTKVWAVWCEYHLLLLRLHAWNTYKNHGPKNQCCFLLEHFPQPAENGCFFGMTWRHQCEAGGGWLHVCLGVQLMDPRKPSDENMNDICCNIHNLSTILLDGCLVMSEGWSFLIAWWVLSDEWGMIISNSKGGANACSWSVRVKIPNMCRIPMCCELIFLKIWSPKNYWNPRGHQEVW